MEDYEYAASVLGPEHTVEPIFGKLPTAETKSPDSESEEEDHGPFKPHDENPKDEDDSYDPYNDITENDHNTEPNFGGDDHDY